MYNFGLGLRGILHIVRLYPAAVSVEAAVDILWRWRDRRWTGNKREMEWRRSLPPACSTPVVVYYAPPSPHKVARKADKKRDWSLFAPPMHFLSPSFQWVLNLFTWDC